MPARKKYPLAGRTRLLIDFSSPQKLLEFIDLLRADGMGDADAYAMDGLDEMVTGSGVPQRNTFLFRCGEDRIPGTSLREILGLAGRPPGETEVSGT